MCSGGTVSTSLQGFSLVEVYPRRTDRPAFQDLNACRSNSAELPLPLVAVLTTSVRPRMFASGDAGRSPPLSRRGFSSHRRSGRDGRAKRRGGRADPRCRGGPARPSICAPAPPRIPSPRSSGPSARPRPRHVVQRRDVHARRVEENDVGLLAGVGLPVRADRPSPAAPLTVTMRRASRLVIRAGAPSSPSIARWLARALERDRRAHLREGVSRQGAFHVGAQRGGDREVADLLDRRHAVAHHHLDRPGQRNVRADLAHATIASVTQLAQRLYQPLSKLNLRFQITRIK